MSLIKVSIIVPIYNVEPYLPRCLDSLCNQTLKDVEIICIDDCSTDHSLKVLQEYAKKDERLKVIAFEKNSGGSRARNEGIDVAHGKYIGFVDSDDWIDLDFYEKLYLEAEKGGYDVVKAPLKNVFDDGREIVSNLNLAIEDNRFNFTFEFTTAIYQRDFIRKYNVRFPEIVQTFEDPMFSLNVILKNPKLGLVDGVFYYYYMRSNSKTKTFRSDQIESFCKSVSLMLDMMSESDLANADYEFLYYKLIQYCFWIRVRVLKGDEQQYRFAFSSLQKVLVEKCLHQDVLKPEESLKTQRAKSEDFIAKYTSAVLRKKLLKGKGIKK